MTKLTKDEAALLVEAHGVIDLLNSREETELLEESNPELLAAYKTLWQISIG